MDRAFNGPVIVGSPDGGMDIEEVAEKTPERIFTMPIDITAGINMDQVNKPHGWVCRVTRFLGTANGGQFELYRREQNHRRRPNYQTVQLVHCR